VVAREGGKRDAPTRSVGMSRPPGRAMPRERFIKMPQRTQNSRRYHRGKWS
jgi:hypothetical protein